MNICANCGASIPEGVGGKSTIHEFVCCPHCVFNPLGCRCKYGEYGVAETYFDPDPLDLQVGIEFGIFGESDTGNDT